MSSTKEELLNGEYKEALEYIDEESMYTIGFGGHLAGFSYEDTVIKALKIADKLMQEPSDEMNNAGYRGMFEHTGLMSDRKDAKFCFKAMREQMLKEIE